MMRTNHGSAATVLRVAFLAIAAFGLSTAIAAAQTTVHVVAAPFNKTVTLPNGTMVSVPMWGYGLADAAGDLLPGEEVSSPGPRITVPVGNALTIVLHNDLPPGTNTSLVIPGQAFAGAPVVAGGRVVSMVPEVAPGSSAPYVFTSLKPGTFLYQSGSHQAVQIQMGLYGALTQDAAAGNAYAGVPYSNEAVLVYSEIDRALHQAVADGTYGTPAGPTSTFNYNPTLFLINGTSYANAASPAIAAGAAGQPTLLRFLNAGLRTHVPVLDNGTFSIVAEDGNKYPFARPQGAILLAAGKTHDALWTPAVGGDYPVYDRSLSLSAEGQGGAGMLAKLRITGAASGGAPVAANDLVGTAEDTAIGGSVVANDTGATSYELATSAGAGAVAFLSDGSFTYTPAANFFGVDSFTYRAVNLSGNSLATVIINVGAVPDAPEAQTQDLGVQATESLPIALGGSDPDGDALTVYLTSLPSNGTLSRVNPLDSTLITLLPTDLRSGPGTGTAIPNGHVIYAATGTYPGTDPSPDPFNFVVSDNGGTSASAAVAAGVSVFPVVDPGADLLSPLLLTVLGPAGENVGAFRWTLEEDRTYHVNPGVLDPNTVSVSFHASYMPVTRSGDETTLADLKVDSSKRYFVSVLPKVGSYNNGGASVAVGQSAVTVRVNSGPTPTAQIRVRVFRDNAPLNGMWDTNEEPLEGFSVTIEDAGGRYGMSAAQQLMDAFGNQIGTTYQPCPVAGTCTAPEVLSYGRGYLLSDAEGWALIQNLAPGKYGVKVVSPGGTSWQQTATIEGTRVIDAWVKANEPTYFAEFGPPGPHADIGFTERVNTLGAGGNTISGQVTNLHHSRPPNFQMFSGATFNFTQPWVALNTGATGGTLLYAQPTDPEGIFTISGVAPGTYQLVIFDSALNLIIATKVINVTTSLALGEVPVQQWYTRLYHYVFTDSNGNGFRDDGEAGIPEQAINLRFRDGTMYQSMPTDGTGFVPFEQVFPFFSWLVAEVDFTRFKATGVTAVVDAGGDPINGAWPGQIGADLDPQVLVPQPQTENGGASYRTETGPVLLEAFQGFIGQSSVLMWGKAPYASPDEVAPDVNVFPFDDFPGLGDTDHGKLGAFDGDQFNGGISGIVHYSVTRAENDPRWGGAEVWEPGIADVTVQLWDATRTKLLNEVTTDSWDASQPTGCQGAVYNFLGTDKDCFDGLRNFNQVRPGVFDGGYAFMSQFEPINPASLTANWLTPVAERGLGFREVPIPAGKYVVRVVPPRGYKIVKEEDKNVDFGDEYIPQEFYLGGYPLGAGGAGSAPPKAGVDYEPLAVPFCVGSLHEVPAELALYPDVPGAYAGDQRPLCDQKLVTLRNGHNPGANFFLFTEAPIAGHIIGFVLDDTANEFDPNAPTFGEKYAPPFLPISIRDWTGREITSTYTDAYGVYNVLVPSTFTANQPIPSGMSPSMLTACINSSTTVNAAGETVPNPDHMKQYTQFCYTFNYMPGATTYLDTPVLPTGAFTGVGQFPVDAELPSGTPVIAKVTNVADLATGATSSAAQIGPYIVDRTTAGSPNLLPGTRTIEVTSGGMHSVPNPAYDGFEGAEPVTILRDYTFGAALNRITVGLARLRSRRRM
ncbi:MAG: Ig-like domain-containing protein [Vicinamibacterales bacterium]|jgi:FtsP/CotA-like multicopper oxidase with cupredoxin domain